jgi:ATP-binding cassette subfamily C protein
VVTVEDVWEAARAAAFADELEKLPMKLHTPIADNGANLSGGQRQRLLLARALVHKPRILILDEATSALDNPTQAKVTAALRERNITRIVVAHRLSTIAAADRIYVLDRGRVVQTGAFDVLLAVNGVFRELATNQRGGA